jgi:hypothetical protein
MARIHRVSQINLLVKSEITSKSGLTATVLKVADLIDANSVNKYYKPLDITEKEAKMLQDITPDAVKEWEWQAYSLQDSINYKGVQAKYSKARMLPNIIDYGAPVGECGLCGHEIRYGYTLKNKVNGNEIIVGSECIHNYGVNVVGGDIGQQAEEVVRAAQRRLENEIKIQAFIQNFPTIKQDIASFTKTLDEMPINLAAELYEVKSAYWVDRKRDLQRLARLEKGMAKNGMLNKKQITVFEDIKELMSELPAATERFEKKTGRKLNPTKEDVKKDLAEYVKQQQAFDRIYKEFAEYGFKSKWIDGIYETFKRKAMTLTDKQKTILNDQYKLFKQFKEKKDAEKNKTPEQKKQEEAVTLQSIKEKANVLVTMKKWVAKKNGIQAVSLEGYIEKETAKGIYFHGHASVKATICCSRCGKDLDNKISRVLGIGPICCEHLGIPRPSEKDLENDEYVKSVTEKVESYIWSGWLPKAYVQVMALDEALKQASIVRNVQVDAPVVVPAAENNEELGNIEF